MFGDGPLTLYLIENSENTLYVHVLSDGALGLHALSLHYMYINGPLAIKIRKTWLF